MIHDMITLHNEQQPSQGHCIDTVNMLTENDIIDDYLR